MTYSAQNNFNIAYIQDLLGPALWQTWAQWGLNAGRWSSMNGMYALDQQPSLLYSTYIDFCLNYGIDPQTGRIEAAYQAAADAAAAAASSGGSGFDVNTPTTTTPTTTTPTTTATGAGSGGAMMAGLGLLTIIGFMLTGRRKSRK